MRRQLREGTDLLDPSLKSAIEAIVPADPADRPYDGRLARYVMQLYENDGAADGGGSSQ